MAKLGCTATDIEDSNAIGQAKIFLLQVPPLTLCNPSSTTIDISEKISSKKAHSSSSVISESNFFIKFLTSSKLSKLIKDCVRLGSSDILLKTAFTLFMPFTSRQIFIYRRRII